MVDQLKLEKVRVLPHQLEQGKLYVSLELKVAGHLCPCGCKTKVFTKLGPAGWSFTEENGLATLFPSLGNWQLPCKSHYWIKKGRIEWGEIWTDEEIEEGRNADLEKKRRYFDELHERRRKRGK